MEKNAAQIVDSRVREAVEAVRSRLQLQVAVKPSK